MITEIQVKNFKNIKEATINLSSINLLVGSNNAGKSSILQAIQFFIAIAQVTKRNSGHFWRFRNDSYSTTLFVEQIPYSPTKDTYVLFHGNEPLRNKRSVADPTENAIFFRIKEQIGTDINEARITIRKGRNKNITIKFEGEVLCNKLADLNNLFSMYVPGLAGIPYSEEYRSKGAVFQTAAKGDSNTVLRNILYHLHQDIEKFNKFKEDLSFIFENTEVEISAALEVDGMINVDVNNGVCRKPIDATGNGVLQAIQVCAYINFFNPTILLLDEPDSHLHPTNQKILAQLLAKISERGTDILIATHSRHLVGALRNTANKIFVKDGAIVETSYRDYDLLLDIGALDEYDTVQRPEVKYVICTEDGKDTKLLKTTLLASGFNDDEFVIKRFSGSSNAIYAKFVADILRDFRNDLSIIIHIDRDGRTDAEINDIVSKIQEDGKTKCFITRKNDIENYYCESEHIKHILTQKGISFNDDEVEDIVNTSIEESKDESRDKLLNRNINSAQPSERGRIAAETLSHFNSHAVDCINGHIIIGKIKSKIHTRWHLSETDLISISPALQDAVLFGIRHS